MTVDPKFGLILKVVKAICVALVALGWATVFDAKTAAIIVFILSGVGAVMDVIINGFSAPVAGPFVPPEKGEHP